MVTGLMSSESKSDCDRESELKAFDDTKADTKGLVDAGVTKIPRMFIQEQQCNSVDNKSSSLDPNFSIPVIDLQGCDTDGIQRTKIIAKLKSACEKWGFFQVINHGVPKNILEEMIDGIRRFQYQDVEVKKEFYSRDYTRKVLYNSNFDLYQAPAASWRDTLTCVMAPNPPNPEELPSVCRDIIIDYTNRVMGVGEVFV